MNETLTCPVHLEDTEACRIQMRSVIRASGSDAKDLQAEIPCPLTRLADRLLRPSSVHEWTWLERDVREMPNAMLERLSVPQLMTICMGYTDYGDSSECGHAMAILSLVNSERISMSDRMAADLLDEAPDSAMCPMERPRELWDGVMSYVPGDWGDPMVGWLGKMNALMAETPTLQRILRIVVRRLCDEPRSTINRLDRLHDHGLIDPVLREIESTAPSSPAAGLTLARATADLSDRARGPADPPTSVASHTGDLPELDTREFQQIVVEALQGLTGGTTMMLGRHEQHACQTAEVQDALAQTTDSLAQATEKIAVAFEQFVSRIFEQHVWESDMRYRDLLQVIDRIQPMAGPLGVELATEHPVASDSLDHRQPFGTARDNTRAPWFVAKCEQLLGPELTVLDLGCGGGGMVLDFTLRGHTAIGLEGSDYSLKRKRAEWRTLHDRLWTCDIAKPFELKTEKGGKRMHFDVITAWDVLEHVTESDLATLLANVRQHLGSDGLFVGSISTRPSRQAPDGSFYHQTVQPRSWWERKMLEHGFVLQPDAGFDPVDFPRGNGASPGATEDFQANPDAGFHFVARPVSVDAATDSIRQLAAQS